MTDFPIDRFHPRRPDARARPGRGGVALALALAFIAQAFALDPRRPPERYQFAEWNVSDGIPYTSVRVLFQTSDGFLWLGTRSGLARFDGLEFTAYTKADVPELIDDEVFSLAEDAEGRLWIGTARGIVRHHKGRWSRPAELRQFESAAVRWVERDGDAMRFGTSDRLFVFRAGRVEETPLPAGVAFKQLQRVARGGDGERLIAAQPSWSIDGTGARRIDAPEGGPLQQLYTAVRDPDGSWWLASEAGLFRFADGRATQVAAIDGQPIRSARSLLFDADGNFWIGTRGELIRVHDGRARVVEKPGVDSIAHFLCLLEDREGNLWGGNDSGLVQLGDVKASAITRDDGLEARSVVSALTARDGGTWLGVWGGGLTRLSPAGVVERVFRVDDGLASEAVWNLAEGSDGALWIGYYDQGVGRLKDGVFTHFDTLPILRPRIRDMKVDDRGTVWISTYNHGLARGDGSTFEAVKLPDVAQTGALLIDSRDRLWVTWPEGVGCFDPGTGRWLEKHASGREPGDAIALIEDASGDLWILRDEMTIQRLREGGTQTFILPAWVGRLTYSGLAHNGELWVNFRNGIARAPMAEFDAVAQGRKAGIEFDFYREIDGMRSVAPNVFTGQGATVARDGRLYFATSKGVAVFDPARIRKNTRPPSVVIDEVVIDKVAHQPGDLAGLRPGRGEIEIHFSALGLSHAAQNVFKYRLRPLERNWVDARHKRVAHYGGLRPGNYRFEVIAANADQVWNTQGAAVAFRLPPHVHQTWWFYAFAALALGGGIWAYVRWREAALQRDKRQLERVVAGRTQELRESNEKLVEEVNRRIRKATALRATEDRIRRLNEELETRVADRTAELQAANRELESFAYSVSHDLRAPLRGIDGWSLAIKEDYGSTLDATALAYLDRVRAESQRLGLLIDNLLNLSRTTRAELRPAGIDLTALVEDTAQRVREAHPEIRVDFACAPDLRCRGDARLLEIALFNLLDNAWKFSAKAAQPRASFGQARTPSGPAFFVRDNGAGFEQRHAAKLFGVFQRLHTEIDYPGTGIGLATVQRIVQRHGGRIWAESIPGEETTFYFQLPSLP